MPPCIKTSQWLFEFKQLSAGIAFTCYLTSIWGLCPPAWRSGERRQGGFWALPHPSDGSQETPTRLCGSGGLWQANSGCHPQLQLLCHHWGHGWSFQIYQTHQKVRRPLSEVSKVTCILPEPSAFLMPSFKKKKVFLDLFFMYEYFICISILLAYMCVNHMCA